MEEKYICPACQAENEMNASLCKECGAALHQEPAPSKDSLCPGCGAVVKEGLQFCTQCGVALSAKKDFSYSLEVLPEKTPKVPTVKKHKKKISVYPILSYVAYGIALLFFLIGFINLFALSPEPVNSFSSLFGEVDNSGLLKNIAECLFMGISSLIFTVLGSAFLLVGRKK